MMRYSKALACAAALLGALTGPARADDRAVQRGQYLAILGDCSGCHTTQHGAPFAGGLPFTAAFGTVYSTNITPDKETGLGNWTADQFYRALHQGIAADGRYLYPAFPYAYFTRISRADSDDLFAYLKSLKPVKAPPHPNNLRFPFNLRPLIAFWNWLYLDDKRFAPDAARPAAWNRGAYLVQGLGHCAACHTPKDMLFGDKQDRALTGAVVDNWFSANLTGNKQDGLGSWSHDDLVRYLATGRNRFATAAGSMEEKVTQSTSRMRPDDRAAIATYLKSLAPQRQDAPGAPDAAQMGRGEAIFVSRCGVCHAAPGRPDPLAQGADADYPKLAGDTLVMGRDPSTVLRIILQGAQSPVTQNEKTTFSMPAFPVLSDAEIADVATYIRNAWGNRAEPVKSGQVRDLRKNIALTPEY
jgi:mono/diheme cytochrome c family protein